MEISRAEQANNEGFLGLLRLCIRAKCLEINVPIKNDYLDRTKISHRRLFSTQHLASFSLPRAGSSNSRSAHHSGAPFPAGKGPVPLFFHPVLLCFKGPLQRNFGPPLFCDSVSNFTVFAYSKPSGVEFSFLTGDGIA